jgi:hypothetical protein
MDLSAILSLLQGLQNNGGGGSPSQGGSLMEIIRKLLSGSGNINALSGGMGGNMGGGIGGGSQPGHAGPRWANPQASAPQMVSLWQGNAGAASPGGGNAAPSSQVNAFSAPFRSGMLPFFGGGGGIYPQQGGYGQ